MSSGRPLDDTLAWLHAREDFQETKARYQAFKAAKEPPQEPSLPLKDLVKVLDDQLPFDLVQGIITFLDKLGLFANDEDARIEGTPYTSKLNDAIQLEDLALLCSILPASKRELVHGRLPALPNFGDSESQLKARLLETLARLALHPALTHLIFNVFCRVHLDVASRWLILLGHDGVAFGESSSHTDKETFMAVLTAFARLLKDYTSLYPLFLIFIQHPAFHAKTPFSLLARLDSPPRIPAWPSSALKPNEQASADLYHPALPNFLMVLDTLLTAVPYLPLMPAILQHYGLIPPVFLFEIMSNHPLAGMRIVAWRIVNKWFGWDGPKSQDMWDTYVYKPKENGTLVEMQTVPAPDLTKSEGDGEEWLPFWPILTGQASWSASTGQLEISVEHRFLDTWVFDSEVKRLSDMTRSSASLAEPMSEMNDASMVSDEAASHQLLYAAEDMSPFLVNICGLHLVREAAFSVRHNTLAASPAAVSHSQIASSHQPDPAFVLTTPARSTLQQLATCTAIRAPVLLSSYASAGKATLLRELHKQLYSLHGSQAIANGQEIVSINLADRSLDAKTLLGSLTSSPTEPGTFVFVEGTLTRALRDGRWLVLEDIDKAADDVLSTIAELVEKIRNRVETFVGAGWGGSGEGSVGVSAGGRWVEAAEGFALFSTRSIANMSSSSSDPSPANFVGCQYWTQVGLDLPNLEETTQIVAGCYPRITADIVDSLVSAWQALAAIANSPTGSSGAGMSRPIGIHDLLVWAKRVQARLPTDILITSIQQNPSFQEEVFLEARDVFFGSFPPQSPTSATKYSLMVTSLQEHLHLSSERVAWMLNGRIPELSTTSATNILRIGRGSMPKAKISQKALQKRRQPYALTKPFLVLLEKLTVCTQLGEPVLMVGETGTGKTAAVGNLAHELGKELVALNLSNQTEASDLLGGFKPVNEAEELEHYATQLVNEFTDIFSRTFSLARNAEYADAVTKAYKKKRWQRLVGLWREAYRMASDRLKAMQRPGEAVEEDSPRKKRKTSYTSITASWKQFLENVNEFATRLTEESAKAAKFAFQFVEGPLVSALQQGHWVLLDEVNLATPETLESLSSLLQSDSASLILTERGDIQPVKRHPDFRLFACMNPATDIGKRDLPPSLRAKFTEIYVPPPDADREALTSIVQGYIGHVAVGDRGLILDVVDFYLDIKALAASGRLADGANQPPHFSMRTLSRALSFAATVTSGFSVRRAVYEGCLMTFTTLLEPNSHTAVLDLLQKHVVSKAKNARSFLSTPPTKPNTSNRFVNIGSFWLPCGALEPIRADDYVLTPSVQLKLVDIARSVAAGRFPVLIQGPTSAGKTSIIEYLARRTGHRFVRINNHEHTDIQEYLGSYVSDPQTGKLVFREGILVKAIRAGDWLVLDELNLAPTDVLEALNRLLDDNRELVIPETQEIVKPHPHFMLFATQNPPGLYGGRKVLSRAFRNRFLEMHFTDVPKDELETILCQRCRIAPSYAKKIVAVFLELQKRRQSTRVFEEKQAFVTLRDLFRWGGRGAVGYEQLAADGYMLIAERARRKEDKEMVKEVLESVMRVQLDEEAIYRTAFSGLITNLPKSAKIVWTTAMQRLCVLASAALAYDEPVLLVGETGSGKTSICQTLAHLRKCGLHTVNCHQNTETADLLGSQRPIRNRANIQESLIAEAQRLLQELHSDEPMSTSFDDFVGILSKYSKSSEAAAGLLARFKHASALFTWQDGPLVQAMQNGDLILLDEVSLADDSVLERLNSVLEPARTLVIAEKGASDIEDVTCVAQPGFQVLATMNPGGDYGKKELSPALRNRFTEIWVPWVTDHRDLLAIIKDRWDTDILDPFAEQMLKFADWFTMAVRPNETPSLGSVVTLRDLLAWADLLQAFTGAKRDAFIHGALMTLVDAIGTTAATSGLSVPSRQQLRTRCIQHLVSMTAADASLAEYLQPQLTLHMSADTLSISPFAISRVQDTLKPQTSFTITAPTVLENARKVMRALQTIKPVLLEGSPGVGKTSLITALASLSAHRLHRINLSDQTDLIDLFGSDLPVEGGRSGEFVWKDAPFLSALQNGDWVLLDEMNLASQAVLEGLNSCLDHRGTIYIPELDRSFARHPDFRIFAAQNPSNQGGARKGLPRSFTDRFTQVYMNELEQEDYMIICVSLYPAIDRSTVSKMVTFVTNLSNAAVNHSRFATQGAPWEFNLRDLLRWFDLLISQTRLERRAGDPMEFLDVLFLQRFRTLEDRQYVLDLAAEVFEQVLDPTRPGCPQLGSRVSRIGCCLLKRNNTPRSISTQPSISNHVQQIRALQAVSTALQAKSLAIIAGPEGAGKTRLVHLFASYAGQKVRTFSMNSQTDTLEMLGTFEQSSINKTVQTYLDQLKSTLDGYVARASDQRHWLLCHHMQDVIRQIEEAGNLSRIEEWRSSLTSIRTAAEQSNDTWAFGLSESLLAILHPMLRACQQESFAGKFEWRDGALPQAMMSGEILHIENANFCSASVLDRLNALFEPQGKLVLTERGMVNGQIVEVLPDPAFRVVMTLDPRYGELSRAMRNRGIEIALVKDDTLSPITTLSSASMLQYSQQILLRHTPSRKVIDPVTEDRQAFDRASRASRIGRINFTAGHASSRDDRSFPISAQVAVALPQQLLLQRAQEYRTQVLYSMLESKVQKPLVQPVLFSQDTQDALRQLDPETSAILSHIDKLSWVQISILFEGMHLQLLQQQARQKPVRELSIVQQSYLAMVAPSKLGQLDHGVETVYPLITGILSALLHAASASTVGDWPATLLQSIEELLSELSSLGRAASLDYTTYQVLLGWLHEALQSTTTSAQQLLSGIASPLEQARRALSLTSGKYQVEIWRHFLPALPATTLRSIYQQLQACARRCDFLTVPKDLRRIYRDLMATLTGRVERHALDDLNSVSSTLLAKLDSYSRDEAGSTVQHDGGLIIAVAQLSEIGEPYMDARTSNLVLRTSQYLRGSSLAQVSNFDPSPTPLITKLFEWARHACQLSSLSTSQSWSIASLVQPALLADAGHLKRSSQSLPLSDLATGLQDILQSSRAHLELVIARTPLRYEILKAVLAKILREICIALSITIPSDRTDLFSAYIALFLEILGGDDCPEYVASLCQALQNLADSTSSSVATLGKAYIQVAMFIWQLYIPNIPIDPAVASHAEYAFQHHLKSRQLEWLVVEEDNGGLPGRRGARHLEDLSQKLADLDRKLSYATSSHIARATGAKMLPSLFLELQQCATSLLNTIKLMDLTKALDACQASALIQARNLQEALRSVISRLTALYESDYSDILHPILLIFAAISTGLDLLHYDSQKRMHADAVVQQESLLHTMVQFPLAFGAHETLHADINTRWILKPGDRCLLGLYLHAHARERSSALSKATVSNKAIRGIADLFQRLHKIWEEDQRRAAEEKAAAESIYRSRKEELIMPSEEEIEADELFALFPVDESLTPSDLKKPVKEQSGSSGMTPPSISQVDMTRLYHLHLHIFSNSGSAQVAADFKDVQHKTLHDALSSHGHLLSEAADAASTVFRMTVLADASLLPETTSSPPNFYQDANPSEAAHCLPALHTLQSRLALLIEAWPEQMVLVDIMERSQAILALPSTSPLARILQAVEQLLPKIDDWESYASKETSLRDVQTKLVELVVSWRRLELHSWARLLQDEERKFTEGLADWWFRFFGAITQASANAQAGANLETVSAYYKDLVALLQSFFLDSPVGQFQARLTIVESFATYSQAMCKASGNSYEAISAILRNVHQFYSSRLSDILEFIASGRAKIETEIQEVIRLASWKDVNILALKQSAQASHRKLYKAARKLRTLLNKPASDFLSLQQSSRSSELAPEHPRLAVNQAIIASMATLFLPSLAPEYTDHTSPAIANLEQTVKRLIRMVERPSQDGSAGDPAGLMASTIIERSASLQQEQPKGQTKDELAKSTAALNARKRRAWADLLKENRRIGLSHRPNPRLLARQQESALLYQTAPFDNEEAPQSALDAQRSFYKLISSLPAVRKSPTAHHDDISSAQLALAVGTVETCMSFIVAERSDLESIIRSHAQLSSVCAHMASFSVRPDNVLSSQFDDTREALQNARDTTWLALSIFEECIEHLNKQRKLFEVQSDKKACDACLTAFSEQRAQCIAQLQAVEELCHETRYTGLLSASQFEKIGSARQGLVDAIQAVDELCSTDDRLAYFIHPVRDALQQILHQFPYLPTTEATVREDLDEDVVSSHADLIGYILVVIQDCRAIPNEPTTGEDGYFVDAGLAKQAGAFKSKTARLRVEEVVTRVNSFLSNAHASLRVSGSHLSSDMLQRVYPVLQAYTLLVSEHLEAYSAWHRSLIKLCQVLANVILNLAQQGFCKPMESDEQASGATQTSEGTGMGAGKGDKNVSNEITGEEQVEGLQDEQEEEASSQQGEDNKEKDEDKVDMSDDFEGRTEDVPDKEDEEENDDEGDDEDEAQDEMGQVDPLDPTAVDDKFWQGDDKEEQPQEQTDEQTKQQPADGKDDEMAAREEDSNGKPKSKEEEEEGAEGADDTNKPEKDEKQNEEDTGDAQPEMDDAGDVDEEGQRNELPQVDEEAEALQLPDDLQLDAPPKEEKDDESGIDEDIDMEGDEPQGDASDEDTDIAGDKEGEPADGDDADDTNATTEEMQDESTAQPEPVDASETMQHSSGNDAGHLEGDDAAMQAELENDTSDRQDRTETQAGSRGRDERQQQAQNAAQESRGTRSQQQSDPQSQIEQQQNSVNTAEAEESADATATTAASADKDQGDPQPDQEAQHLQDKPRNLGDAMKEWMRKLDSIPDAGETTPPKSKQTDNTDTKDIEYTHGAEEEEEMQAAGPAEDEELAKKGRAVDEKNMVEDFQAMEVDGVPEASLMELDAHSLPDAQDQNAEQNQSSLHMTNGTAQDDPNLDGNTDLEPSERQDQLESDEQQLRTWLASDRSTMSPDAVWRFYENLTRDLSFSLTESLRLVLEPTLATRLKGDYRTGKRLNMKKIIPYIASDFTKDKIWLRRTRPSQREYQILLSLDDSRSMADSHSVHLAYQALALVSQALTRLEAGQISICRFGEAIDFVHNFEDGPVNESAGASLIEAFKFAQKGTDVRALLQRSLQQLALARESRRGSSADLWQMQIIISDGICQDLDDLRALLRKATEQKIMVVFIVVDSLHQPTGKEGQADQTNANSILSMNSVSYVRGKDGGLELKMERYMDTFPFDYYVVLRDVASLPDVLSETLRQFFERVSSDR